MKDSTNEEMQKANMCNDNNIVWWFEAPGGLGKNGPLCPPRRYLEQFLHFAEAQLQFCRDRCFEGQFGRQSSPFCALVKRQMQNW